MSLLLLFRRVASAIWGVPASRTLIVEAEDRIIDIKAETREMIIDTENRTMTIEAESRFEVIA